MLTIPNSNRNIRNEIQFKILQENHKIWESERICKLKNTYNLQNTKKGKRCIAINKYALLKTLWALEIENLRYVRAILLRGCERKKNVRKAHEMGKRK